MPILGPSNSVANNDMISKIWTNEKYGQMRIQWSYWVENIVGKGEIAPFPTMFSKSCLLLVRQNEYQWSRVKQTGLLWIHNFIVSRLIWCTTEIHHVVSYQSMVHTLCLYINRWGLVILAQSVCLSMFVFGVKVICQGQVWRSHFPNNGCYYRGISVLQIQLVFSSPEQGALRVSYCDYSPSVGAPPSSSVRPSSLHISLFTL